MKIGILGLGDQYSIDAALAGASEAAATGFDSYWLPGEVDPISTITVVGREVPSITLGISVVPVYSRHPVALAAQALMTNQAVDGRLVLGIGLSHAPIVVDKWGQPFDRPIRYLREFLDILVPLLDDRHVDVQGAVLSARHVLRVDDAPRPPLLVAAMGPQTLRVAGRYADGTDTWMTGPRTLAAHTVPTISAAAAAAGKAQPRIAAGMPICVTDNPQGARVRAAQEFVYHGQLPSYRAMLEREGLAGPEDIVIVGDEDRARSELLRYRDAGVTDFIACPFGDLEERERTKYLLRKVASELTEAT
jgi:5,10-methylenetetrahydromethanopterin reductase